MKLELESAKKSGNRIKIHLNSGAYFFCRIILVTTNTITVTDVRGKVGIIAINAIMISGDEFTANIN